MKTTLICLGVLLIGAAAGAYAVLHWLWRRGMK